MSASIKNVSLFIPRVFTNHTKQYVTEVFEKMVGSVERVDFVLKQDENGNMYNSVYVHFNHWVSTKFTRDVQYELEMDGSSKIYYTWEYWIILENKSKKHASGERKQRIQLDDVVVPSTKATLSFPIAKCLPDVTPLSFPIAKCLPTTNSKINQIKEIILSHEDELSDGFGFYCNSADAVLEEIAKSILEKCSDVKQISQLDAELKESEKDKQQMAEIDAFLTEEEQMSELEDLMDEAEYNEEDDHLITIDGRYVREIEHENAMIHLDAYAWRCSYFNLKNEISM